MLSSQFKVRISGPKHGGRWCTMVWTIRGRCVQPASLRPHGSEDGYERGPKHLQTVSSCQSIKMLDTTELGQQPIFWGTGSLLVVTCH